MKPITITVTPGMAEQIREFCIAHKAIHMSAIDRHSAAVIELDNLATSLIEDEHDALEAELIGSMIASSFEQIEERAQEMQIGGPTSEPRPTGAKPINFFNDEGEVYTVPDQGGIRPNNIPTPSAFADAKIWAAWLSSWMIDLILVQNQRENAGAMD